MRPKSIGVAPGWYRPVWWHPYDRHLGDGFRAALRALYGTRTARRVGALHEDRRGVRRGLARFVGSAPGPRIRR